MKRWIAVLAGALTASAAGMAGLAQTTASQEDVVQVVVRVTDADGRPARGLGEDDIAVRIGGRSAAIRSFREVSIPRGERAIPPLVDSPRSDVADNDSPPDGRLIAVVVDESGLPPDLSSMPRLRSFLDLVLAEVTSDDAVSFVTGIRRGTPVMSDFSRALDDQIQAAESMPTRERQYLDDAILSDRTRHQTLRAIIRAMGEAPETQRVLILVTDNLDHREYAGAGQFVVTNVSRRERDATIASARSAGVVIHVVDIQEASTGIARTSQEERHGELQAIVEPTGGRAVSALADVGGAVGAVFSDISHHYLIGFERAAMGPTGRIEVQVGDDGLQASVTPAVIDESATSRVDPNELTERLERAIRFGVPHAGLPMLGFAAASGPTTGGRARTYVAMEIAFPIAPPDEDVLPVRFTAFDAADMPLASFRARVELADHADRPDVRQFAWQGELQLPAGTVRLGMGVASHGLSLMGTVQAPVELPDPSRPLAVAGMVLMQSAGESAPAPTPGAWQVTLDRIFDRDATVDAVVPVFWQAAAGRVTLRATLLDAGGVVIVDEPRLLEGSLDADGQTGRQDVHLPLPLSGLEPGRYQLVVEASSTNGATRPQRSVWFTVR